MTHKLIRSSLFLSIVFQVFIVIPAYNIDLSVLFVSVGVLLNAAAIALTYDDRGLYEILIKRMTIEIDDVDIDDCDNQTFEIKLTLDGKVMGSDTFVVSKI